MSLKIYNVLTKKKELFRTLYENHVNMYACGITVSGDAHIGHAYQAIVFDMIRKYLEFIGYNVTYVRNYTDVDDKIILKSRSLGISPTDYANDIMKKTDEELERLNVGRPTIMAKATESISDMINFITKLIDSGHAYSNDNGDVFFRVESFPRYGNFSNRIIDDAISGVRKEVEPGKEDDRDFALWKNAKDDEIFWDSPFGRGRPGWHIECSTMSMKYLGETLDIHGGGKDLIFPHHENEIAQSEALTNKPFSRFWVHNGLIKVNGQKMSKSLGNSIYLSDLLSEFHPDVIRLTLLQNSYRSDMNVIDGMFNLFEEKIYTLYKLFTLINEGTINNDIINRVRNEFMESMDNDFNTSIAITNLYGYMSEMTDMIKNKNYDDAYSLKVVIRDVYSVLEIGVSDPQEVINQIKRKHLNKSNLQEEDILELIDKRNNFKKEKNFASADSIRNELNELNIELMDTREGTAWDIKWN